MARRTSHGRVTGSSSLLILAALSISLANGLEQKYCSNFNTGSDYPVVNTDFMSNGACHDQCVGEYAFAVLQGRNCWCSNYVPAQTQDNGDCNNECPGFPSEKCGGNNLYGYIQLDKSPSGTKPASTSTSDTPTPLPPPRPPSTSRPSFTLASTTTHSSSSSHSKSSSSSSTSSSSTWTPTPVTSVQITTVSNQVVTQTVTNTPTAPPEALKQSNKDNGVSSGVIAGAVTGAVAGFVMIIGLLFYLLLRRRRADHDDAPPGSAGSAGRKIGRNTSVLSRTGLLDKVYPSAGPTTTRNSVHGMETGTDVSPASMMERRNSRPLFYDQRLNPNVLMEHPNGSHTSVISIQDNRDYTRTLNITNPDPPRPSYAPSEK